MRYNCYQSILIAVFLFHTTWNYEKLSLLRWMKILYVPYLSLNLVYFYVTSMLTEMKIKIGFDDFTIIKFGFYTFDSILE
jgi:hypothetical protein